MKQPEEQESGQEIILQENTHSFPGSIQAICMQKHEHEQKKISGKRFKIDENRILNQDEKL